MTVMTTLSPLISAAAREVFEQLEANPRNLPTLDSMEAYRKSVRAGWQPQIDQTLAEFEGLLETVSINGIRCLQLTPAGWNESNGLCVLYCYGGGFISGSPEEDLILSAPLTTMTGARFICVDYMLSPEFPFPLPQNDVMAVYRALLEELPASRLAVTGDSAGGNQALGLLTRARSQNLPMPRCLALLSPWIDLNHQGDSHRFNDGRDPSLSCAYLEFAATAHAGDTPRDDADLSPLYADLTGLPATIITTGSRDLLMSEAIELSRKLQRSGVEAELQVWDELWHVFEFYPIPEKTESLERIAAFIKKHSADPKS